MMSCNLWLHHVHSSNIKPSSLSNLAVNVWNTEAGVSQWKNVSGGEAEKRKESQAWQSLWTVTEQLPVTMMITNVTFDL